MRGYGFEEDAAQEEVAQPARPTQSIYLLTGKLLGLTGLSSALGAAASSMGAAILLAAGHDGYDASDAAKIGATGFALFTLTLGLGKIILAKIQNLPTEDFAHEDKSCGSAVIGMSTEFVLSGAIGQFVLNTAGATSMTLTKASLSTLTGGAVLAGSACPFALCLGVSLFNRAIAQEESRQSSLIQNEGLRLV